MSAPTTSFRFASDRYALKDLTWERSQAIPPGKVMFCRGRKILGYGTIENLPRVKLIPPRTDTLVIAAADYDDVKAWVG